MAPRSPAHAACSAAALLCTFALLSTFARADCGGFAQSCTGITVNSQGELTASCDNGHGGTTGASLDLNSYIGNNDGSLGDGAGFAASCTNITWFSFSTDNQGVQAQCLKADGSSGGLTTFNVEARVSNNFGTLSFNNCRRRALLQADEEPSAIAGRKMLRM